MRPATVDAGDGLDPRLEAFARALVERRLATVAIVLVEGARPISFLCGQTAHALAPLFGLIGREEDAAAIARALEDRATLGRFVDRVEELAAS